MRTFRSGCRTDDLFYTTERLIPGLVIEMNQKKWRKCSRLLRICELFFLLSVLAACGGKNSTSKDQPSSGSTLSDAAADQSQTVSAASEAGEEPAEEDDKIRIGLVVKENSRDHWIRMKEVAEQHCTENGAELIYLAGTEDAAAAEQIAEVDQLIEEKVDAICISPVSDEMVYAALKRAGEAGIPVITIDTDTAYKERMAYIGTDNYEAARAGAVYAAGQTGRGGTAVILRGTPGDSVHDDRAAGIADGLTEQGITVARTLCTTAADAGEDVQKLLQLYPDLDLLITTEDAVTSAAWKRVLALGNTTVKLYGFDGSREIAEITEKDGQVLGTTAQFPEEIGIRAVQAVLDYLESGDVEDSVEIPYEIVTPETAEAYIKKLPAEMEGKQE